MTPKFTLASGLVAGDWLEDVLTGPPPVRFRPGSPFDSIDLRPGRVVVLGGQPGSGKTAALLQVVVGVLRLNQAVRVLVANCEMSPQALLERVAAHLSGVPLSSVIDRALTADQRERVRAALGAFAEPAARLAFLDPPFTLEHAAAAANATGATLLVIDYLQRFRVQAGSDDGDGRERVEDMMAGLRTLADQGAAVLAAAAVARQRGRSGSTYAGLGLASYRGSSEIEFAANLCFVLQPDGDGGGGALLKCEKNRDGPLTDVALSFDGALQRFSAATTAERFDRATQAPPRRTNPKGDGRCAS